MLKEVFDPKKSNENQPQFEYRISNYEYRIGNLIFKIVFKKLVLIFKA